MSDQSTPVTRLPLRKGASLRWLPFLFIFLQSVLYGLGDPISKSAYEVLPVYSLLTARYGIALAFLLLVFGRRIWRGLKVCSPRDWLLPSLCMGGAYVANNIALELTAATSVAFLRSLSTVMTPLLALAFYRRKFGKKHIPVQLLVLVGLYLLIFARDKLRVRLRDLWCFAGTGIVSLLLFSWCYFSGMQEASLSVMAVLLYTSPAFIVQLKYFPAQRLS